MEDKTTTLNQKRARDLAADLICTTLGMIEGNHNFCYWADFRDQLLTNDKLDSFRSDSDFKTGLYLISKTIDYMIELDGIEELIKQKPEFYELAYVYMNREMQGKNYKAVQKLLECLEFVTDTLIEKRWEPEDIEALRRQLQTIAYTLGMILEAVRQGQVNT